MNGNVKRKLGSYGIILTSILGYTAYKLAGDLGLSRTLQQLAAVGVGGTYFYMHKEIGPMAMLSLDLF